MILVKSIKLLRQNQNIWFQNLNKYTTKSAQELIRERNQKSRSDKGNEDNKNYFGAIALLSIPIATFCLGIWQVRRREWKIQIIDMMQKRTNAAPIELPENMSEILSPENEYRPFKVKGYFDHKREIVITIRRDLTGRNSKPGAHVITPFKVKGRDLEILVNRGFIPRDELDRKSRELDQNTGEIEIVGLLRFDEVTNNFTVNNKPEKNEWHNRNVNEIANYLRTAPIFLDSITETKTAKNGVIPGQTIVNLRNEHLSYIITWFSLSALTSFMWYRRFLKYFS